MDARDKAIILEFKSRLSPDVAKHVKRLIVYGSRARGEATEYSDLDVVALVDKLTPELEEHLEDIA